MRKVISMLLVLVLVLSAGVPTAFAAHHARGNRGNCPNNGICDTCGACGHFVDENGDGICDTCGKQPAAGNKPNSGAGKHHNSGSHHGGGHKRHH